MTDVKMAEKYADENWERYESGQDDYKALKQAYLAGFKAGRPQWHKVTNWEDNDQFPNDELETYLVRLYQGHYVVCELDITEGYRQFFFIR